MLTRERIEEVMDDAVSRGRVTADDAQKLAQALVSAGASRPTTCCSDLEQLLGRAGDVGGARKRGTTAAGRARSRSRGHGAAPARPPTP